MFVPASRTPGTLVIRLSSALPQVPPSANAASPHRHNPHSVSHVPSFVVGVRVLAVPFAFITRFANIHSPFFTYAPVIFGQMFLHPPGPTSRPMVSHSTAPGTRSGRSYPGRTTSEPPRLVSTIHSCHQKSTLQHVFIYLSIMYAILISIAPYPEQAHERNIPSPNVYMYVSVSKSAL